MALTQIQKDIMASIAANRSDSSYVAGGVVLNMNWPRVSDDIDIFHDTDEEIGAAADADWVWPRRLSAFPPRLECLPAWISNAD